MIRVILTIATSESSLANDASATKVLFFYGSDHLRGHAGIAALLISVLLLAAFLRKASKKRKQAFIDLQHFRTRVFSASAVTQFTTNGLLVAGQMLIPVYLVRAAGELPSTVGWLMAPLV